MHDPFDDLKGLEGLSRPSLPAEEVRRRGDRLRRRRTALQAVGAAAAVAVIASGGMLATGGDPGTGPDIGPAERTGTPAPSPTAEAAEHPWITSLPDGFPLDWALPEPGGDVPELAADGFERAVGWLDTCDEPLDRDHPVVDGGLGDVHSGSWTTGRYVWRTVTTPAPEICDGCGLVWHHHQGVALGGDRLVVLQLSTPGVLEQAGGGTTTPLPRLLQAAAGLAAGGMGTTETFGPEGMGGLDLGTSTSQGPGAALVDVLGGARCQAFRLRGPGRPTNNVDGFSEGERGVVVLFARTGMTTPQGVGLGSSRQDVLEAHPGGEDLVPG